MSDSKQRTYFWLGNAILAVCLVMLFNMGALWQQLGEAAMVVWVVLAGVGMYCVMQDKRTSSLGD